MFAVSWVGLRCVVVAFPSLYSYLLNFCHVVQCYLTLQSSLSYERAHLLQCRTLTAIQKGQLHVIWAHLNFVSDSSCTFRSSYTMGCPSVRGDNPRALASGLSYVQVDNCGQLCYTTYTLHITRYFVLKVVY